MGNGLILEQWSNKRMYIGKTMNILETHINVIYLVINNGFFHKTNLILYSHLSIHLSGRMGFPRWFQTPMVISSLDMSSVDITPICNIKGIYGMS